MSARFFVPNQKRRRTRSWVRWRASVLWKARTGPVGVGRMSISSESWRARRILLRDAGFGMSTGRD